MALLEARPYRPFKSSEEYLEAMKEDLAEWLNTMYPELLISAEIFMDRLDTGVALCKHANYVRQAAENYLIRRQARNKSMTRSMTSGLVGPILAMGSVHYLPAAKSGTFFARDNVSNFITWCRKSLKIIECLLFETDDLIMRKNEKHVILCLLEVARRGAKFGMLAPMLIQMERQIDREIAADNKANNICGGTQTYGSGDGYNGRDVSVSSIATEADLFDTDSENGDEDEEAPMLMYGPQPQIITNDLKSLDEMVRDLVEKCTCPSQFPMIRVAEGKYRIGDTKVLIFVRILRSHVMVRVGGGWDTLSHYLDKHDPCRCKLQHRSSVAARLIPRTNNQSNFIELHKAQVIFERSPPAARKMIPAFNSQTPPTTPVTATHSNLSPMNYEAIKARSRSPTPQRKFLNHFSVSSGIEKQSAGLLPSPSLMRRSMSPSPRRLIDMRKKQTSLDSSCNNGPKSLPLVNELSVTANHSQMENMNPMSLNAVAATSTPNQSSDTNANTNKFENVSDNGSEISDEGYRSLGVIQSNAQKRESFHSHASLEDVQSNVRLDHTSSDSQISPVDDSDMTTKSAVTLDYSTTGYSDSTCETIVDADRSQATLTTSRTITKTADNKFEQSGIFITDEDITVNIAHNTGLRKTDFSTKIFGAGDVFENPTGADSELLEDSKIRCPPITIRRRSLENKSCSGSLQDLHNHNGLPVFNRKQPVFCSMRKPNSSMNLLRKSSGPPIRDVTKTCSGRMAPTNDVKKRTVNTDTFVSEKSSPQAFERKSKIRSSQILYDNNGRRVKACTTSLTTSPVKSCSTSPLAQQLLEAASSAKNDAQILEKMKNLLSRYASPKSNKTADSLSNANKMNAKKAPAYEDFTSAWVHSNGNLERSNSCSPPAKAQSKRSSAASSVESTHSRDMSVIVSPRRDRGRSKIPGPIRQHTELY